MFKIYLNDHCFSVAALFGPVDPSAAEVSFPEIDGQTKFLQKVQNTKRTVLAAKNPWEVFGKILSWFPVIEAAGGLTTNQAGDVLMIFRNGRWDLPKGKLEDGEEIEMCAVREVSEECGIRPPQIVSRLTDTFHMYPLDGRWVMKRTAWYRMEYGGNEPLVPQVEEGITGIEWVPESGLARPLENTYPTIVDVLRAAGYAVRS